MDSLSVSRPLTAEQAAKLDPLVLAYVGDGVETLYVRKCLALASPTDNAGKLHRKTVALVSAEAQARQADACLAAMTQEEQSIYRLARNHKTKSSAKNATIGAYHKASGLEAVWGYLYLTGQAERLQELLSLAIEAKE